MLKFSWQHKRKLALMLLVSAILSMLSIFTVSAAPGTITYSGIYDSAIPECPLDGIGRRHGPFQVASNNLVTLTLVSNSSGSPQAGYIVVGSGNTPVGDAIAFSNAGGPAAASIPVFLVTGNDYYVITCQDNLSNGSYEITVSGDLGEPDEEPECEVDCEPECEVDCEPECEVDCEPECEVDCEPECEVDCEPECEVDCEPECEVDCEPECEVDCEPECEVDCEPECEVDCKPDGGSKGKSEEEDEDNVVYPPDNRINWQYGHLDAVIYEHEDGGGVVVYCYVDGETWVGLVIDQTVVDGVPANHAQDVSVLEYDDNGCHIAFFILDSGEYQINIWTWDGKLYEIIADNLYFRDATMRAVE